MATGIHRAIFFYISKIFLQCCTPKKKTGSKKGWILQIDVFSQNCPPCRLIPIYGQEQLGFSMEVCWKRSFRKQPGKKVTEKDSLKKRDHFLIESHCFGFLSIGRDVRVSSKQEKLKKSFRFHSPSCAAPFSSSTLGFPVVLDLVRRPVVDVQESVSELRRLLLHTKKLLLQISTVILC